jgi:dTMP kinase
VDGLFITFEGGEGAGKSTVIQHIFKWLQLGSKPVIQTREPGGIRIAEKIRSIILDKDNKEMDERTEALLYAAARRQHLIEKVIPAVQAGKVVLCDRFIDSSLAYQGFARGIAIDDILAINTFAINRMMPDLTIYFDVSPEIGLDRVKRDTSREINRLDLEAMDFHKRVREGYHSLVEMFPNRIVMINAEMSLEEVIIETKDMISKKGFVQSPN